MADPSLLYDRAFFSDIAEGSARSASRVVPELLTLFAPASVVDVGCGSGTWLAEFGRHGVTDLLGIDGPWIDGRGFLAGASRFLAHDLRHRLTLERQFDLVVSLEVAEHLPVERGESFVADLVGLGPAVAFSASILDCTGTGEVNQRWPDYWAGVFERFDYVPLDWLRPRIWNDPDIEWWYRQNLILYVRRDHIAVRENLQRIHAQQPASVARLVHPENYAEKMQMLLEPTLRQLLRALPAAAFRAVKRRLPGTRETRVETGRSPA